MELLAPLLERCAIRAGNDSVPRLLRNPSTKRVLGKVSPETAWQCLEESLRCHRASARTVLDVRRTDDAYQNLDGAHAWRWSALELQLYIEDQQDDFVGRKKLALLADPSVFGGRGEGRYGPGALKKEIRKGSSN